jgi:uroporphyrinogen-III synthase
MNENGSENEAVDPARLSVAVFRPDDERIEEAVELIDALGADPVPDPILTVEPTGARPRTDADVVAFTAKTGVELAADAGFSPVAGERETRVAAIGEKTADALRDAGYPVDVVPEEYSSAGLVAALKGSVDGARVEVARSDHGSATLPDGLEAAGAFVHETVLYRLVRPDDSGRSAELAAAGDLEVALFTSSMTVEQFLAAAADRGVRDRAVAGLDDAVVGAIGAPTRETAEREGIQVDVVPETAAFEKLATAAIERAAPSYHR